MVAARARAIGGGRPGRSTEAAPEIKREQTNADNGKLTDNEADQPFKGGIHKAVRMEADTEHVDAEPGETGHDVAKDGEVNEAAVADQTTPSRMENQSVPDDDHQGAIFLRVPSPEAAPGLVGPDTPEDGADEAKQSGETNDAINHFGKSFAKFEPGAGTGGIQFLF